MFLHQFCMNNDENLQPNHIFVHIDKKMKDEKMFLQNEKKHQMMIQKL